MKPTLRTAGPAPLLSLPVFIAVVLLSALFGFVATSFFDDPVGKHTSVTLVSLAALPVLWWLARVHPGLTFGVYLASQPLEAFEIQTPVGTLSAGIIVLTVLLLTCWRELIRIVESNNMVRATLLLCIIWTMFHILRAYHTPANEVLRQVLMLSSFTAMWCIGCWGGYNRLYLHACAGAALGLMTMAALGVGASFGLVSLPSRVNESRTIFGVTSPLIRNFGLDLPYDATSLVASVAASGLAVVSFKGTARRSRAMAVCSLGILLICSLLVFQSRGMVMQLMVGSVGGVMLSTRYKKTVVLLTLVGLGLGVAPLYRSMYATDVVSSELRIDGVLTGLDILTSGIGWMPAGVSGDAILSAFMARSRWAELVPVGSRFQPIHNLPLHEFVSGGVLVGATFMAIWLTTLRSAWRLWRTAREDVEAAGILLGVLMVSLVIVVEPVSSNAAGLWVLLGVVAGAAARVVDEHRGQKAGRRDAGR